MQAEYQVDHRLFDQVEVVYRLCPTTTESNGSQPGKDKNRDRIRIRKTIMLMHNFHIHKCRHHNSQTLA